jgi:pimeloyl-ACP methyl ester carboxylesterase
MPASFVLVHSPSVGPRTWEPVARRLTQLGWHAAVPSLLHVGDGGPPFWPRVVDAVRAGLDTSGSNQVVLVAHSNAGLFIPVITAALPGQVRGCIFVDAALPPRFGTAPVVPPELLMLLRGKASGGLLPRWTDWWEEEDDVAPLFPDQQTRHVVIEEQPRLPLSYYEASIPVPTGWDARSCAYLLFGPPYDEVATEAHGRGWVVEQLPGGHLHQLVDPDGVARSLLAIADQMGVTET